MPYATQPNCSSGFLLRFDQRRNFPWTCQAFRNEVGVCWLGNRTSWIIRISRWPPPFKILVDIFQDVPSCERDPWTCSFSFLSTWLCLEDWRQKSRNLLKFLILWRGCKTISNWFSPNVKTWSRQISPLSPFYLSYVTFISSSWKQNSSVIIIIPCLK